MLTLAGLTLSSCMVAHIASIFVGIIVSAYYLAGAVTHNIPNTLVKGRVCSALFFVVAVPVRYFQFTGDVFWFALARGVEQLFLFAAVVYVCEHVAENIFTVLRLPFPRFVKFTLAVLRIFFGLAVIAPSIELVVTQTNRASHAQTIVALAAQLVGSLLACLAFAYFTHLVVKFRRWKIASGMTKLHDYARTLARKKYEAALVSAIAGIYSALLLWTILDVVDNLRGDPDAQMSIARCPLESIAVVWAPMAIVVGMQLATHVRSSKSRRSDKTRSEIARTDIARPLPSPVHRV